MAIPAAPTCRRSSSARRGCRGARDRFIRLHSFRGPWSAARAALAASGAYGWAGAGSNARCGAHTRSWRALAAPRWSALGVEPLTGVWPRCSVSTARPITAAATSGRSRRDTRYTRYRRTIVPIAGYPTARPTRPARYSRATSGARTADTSESSENAVAKAAGEDPESAFARPATA